MSYRTYDSYTTADGTTYQAIYKGDTKNKSGKRTSRGRNIIEKIDADGNRTVISSSFGGGSASGNKNAVAATFDSFKEGLIKAEEGQNLTYTDDDVNTPSGGGFLSFSGDKASTLTLSDGTVLSSAAGNTANEVKTLKRLADEIANTSSTSTSTTTTTEEEEEIDNEEEVTEEDLNEVGIDAATYNAIITSPKAVTGTGGISGNYTIEPGYFPAPVTSDTAVGTGAVTTTPSVTATPGPSGTYTTPAQTFESNVDNQVADLTGRAAMQQQLYQPQTIAENQAAGVDMSAYTITQKLYRNPNTGHQLYILFQGGKPMQQIPAGYVEVKATGELEGAYNPLTAGQPVEANQGGYISGYNQAGSVTDPTNLSNIYGTVSFQDPTTGQIITQTGPEYLQSLANRAGQATFNPATMVASPQTAVMTEATSPGTVLASTTGQALPTAPLVTGSQLAQVSDVTQAKGPGTPAITDAEGNVISKAVDVPTSVDATVKAAAPVIKTELESFDAQTQAAPSDDVTAQTQDTTSVSGLDAATGTAQTVADVVGQAGVPTRTLQTGPDGELITQTGVDQAQVGQTFGTGEVQAASVQSELASLMSQFDDGKTPAWAAGSMRKATAVMAQRGLGASSMAGQAIIQAAMEAALPIAQIDAGNKQQMALFKAEQRSKFLQMDFDQEFQRRVTNAARVSEIANINFSAEQQIALENSRAAQTMDLTNLNNKQALIMSEAAALSQLDMARLTNRQQAQVQNAQNFLQLDMANLNNKQSTALFKAQSVTNAMLSDVAQENANEQFNATSENQMTQFSANLASQVSQFNAAQQNAINQFNAEEANAILEFNAALQNQREMFNSQNYLAVAQANAKWRQDITTTNTATQNVANLTYAKEVNGLTQKTLDDYWMKERDIMSYAFKQSESSMDRAVRILLGEQTLTALREKIEFANEQDKAAFWSRLVLGDVSLTDVFKFGGGD